MSLFVGNVSKHVTLRQLETLFKKYGKVKIDLRDRFAFVQFDNDNHGQAAKKQLQHETFHGLELNIEWSKNSGRFGENNKRKNGGGVQRKRSRSRQNRWRRQDNWGRRSPSNDRRSPSYSGNTDVESFVSVCPRDEIILKKLKAKAKDYEIRHRDSHKKESQGSKNQVSISGLNEADQNGKHEKSLMQEQPRNNGNQSNTIIQQEEGIIHEDGQIPTTR